MNILCVEQDRTKLRRLKRDTREFVPGACITVCRDPCKGKAEVVAKAKGYDMLLTNTVFDGFNLDGTVLVEQIRRVNPHVNIIFVIDHADKSAAYSAWEFEASVFFLCPYEKQRLVRAFADPCFVSECAR